MFLLFCLGSNLMAQETMQTVTRSVTKSIACSSSTVFSVTGEKSSITVKGWNKNFIEVRIMFSASHPDKKTAVLELGYMQYALVKENNRIELRNGFSLPPAVEHIYSKLEVRMELMVPSGNVLQVTNKYGNILIGQFSGKITADISLGDLDLTDLSGEVSIRSSYSGIRGSGIRVTSLHCVDEQSKISMELDEGSYFFNSKHGDLDLQLKHIKALNIQAMRSDVTIRAGDIGAFRYNVSNKEGLIYLPGKYSHQVIKNGKQTSFITGAASMPLVHVTSTFNAVTIK